MGMGVIMGVSKQAKTLSDSQVKALTTYLSTSRNPKRNLTILYLSVKAGLRAKEIAALTWKMTLDGEGDLGTSINLTNKASKGRSGRIIPINKTLSFALKDLLNESRTSRSFDLETSYVVTTERSEKTSAQVIVNMFKDWYSRLGFVGCSSHSGRRTMITNAAKKVGLVGGSLRDVQLLAGHSSLQTTQRYIDYDTEAQRSLMNLI
jgi:integrase